MFYGKEHYDSQRKYIFEVPVRGKSLIGELPKFAEGNFDSGATSV